ncbi:phosphoglycerate mutase [Thozetella sp. PMI_491]|nr:phosphoglycerate mutase [Thozetella sp. PMI_491]
MASEKAVSHFKFSVVPGIFFDYAEKTKQDRSYRVTTLPQLGILDREYEWSEASNATSGAGGQAKPWERLRDYVHHLNEKGAGATTYKVLYLSRHGFGWHNYMEAKVGTEAWDNYWSRLDGDGEIVWADAHLHEKGIEQAKVLGQFYADGIANDGIPFPGALYTSPLARCLETSRLAFTPSYERQGAAFRPIVKELLRETIIEHTCDRRSSRSWIAENYPDYVIEPGFTEEDELWASHKWETIEDHIKRKQAVLEEIFSTDSNAFIALTIHSGAISAVLGALEHPEFHLQEGTSFAMLIRADKVDVDQ